MDPWLLLAVAGFVVLNAFFVAAEFAIVKVRPTQLASHVARGDRRAIRADRIVHDLNAYLNACQLGITLASLGLGWVGEPAFARLLEPVFRAAGLSEVALHTAAFGVAFAIISALHIVLGEIVPKAYSIQAAERTTLWLALPLHAFYVLFKPAIVVLNAISNGILRIVGVRPGREETAHTEEELRLLLAEAGEKNVLKQERAELLLRAFRLSDLTAKSVMTPRTRVVALDAKRPFEETLARAKEAGFSRFPVVEEAMDRVLGTVHYRDLVELDDHAGPTKDLRAIARPVVFVPETAPLEKVLNTMLRRGLHMTIVTDEFSGTAGILTLEDIFEEIFGEIRDEFDIAAEGEGPIRRLDDEHFVMDGQTPLHQVEVALGLPMHDADAVTLGGYITAVLGRLPNRGERIRLGHYDGVVREVDKRRVQTIELWAADGSSD